MKPALSEIAEIPKAASGPGIELWPLARLISYARNPRKNDHAIAQMVASIEQYGFKIPVLAQSDGTLIDGHLRLKAARQLGLTEVPVLLCDEWTEAQRKGFRLMANQSANWAHWDTELLTIELDDLKEMDFDLALTGFNANEIEAFLAGDNVLLPAEPVEPPDYANEDQRRPEMMFLPLTPDQHGIVMQAVAAVRRDEDDLAMSEGRCMELVAANYLSASPGHLQTEAENEDFPSE